MSYTRYDVPNESESVLSGLSLYYDSMYVGSGGTATDTTLDYGGYMIVSEGGVAQNTTVNSYGSMNIYSSGVAQNTIVNNGVLNILSSGVADNTTLNGHGGIEISPGGTATGVTLNPGTILYINSGGTALSIAENGGFIYEYGSASFVPNTFSDVVLDYGMSATVHSGTTALRTTVNSYGRMYVTGGSADSTTINSDGYAAVGNGGLVNHTTINSGASMVLYTSSGWEEQGIGATTASNTTVLGNGVLYLSSGAVADGINVAGSGRVWVSSGATATWIVAEPGARIHYWIALNTVVTGTSGGTAFALSDGKISDLKIDSGNGYGVESGATATNPIVQAGGSLFVYDYGSAVGIIEDGGYVVVSASGSATFTPHEFSGAVLKQYESATVHSGTTATDTTVSCCVLHVYSSGVVNGATVSGGVDSYGWVSAGRVILSSGATADGVIRADELGRVRFESGAKAGAGLTLVENGGGFELGEGVEVTFSPNSFSNQTLMGLVTVHSGTTATDISVVSSGGAFHLYKGGSAYNIALGSSYYDNCSGVIHSNAVASGLSGTNWTIEGGAVVYDLNGGGSIAGTVSGANVTGYVTILNGGRMVSATAPYIDGMGYGIAVQDGGTLEKSVLNGGYGYVSSGATVTDLTVTAGALYVYTGATVDGLNFSGGTLSVNGGSVTGLVLAGEHAYLYLRVDPTSDVFVSGTMADGSAILLKDGRFEHFSANSIGLGIANGGVADDITFVNGWIGVSSGGTATNFNVSSGGSVYVSAGGTLTSATFHGVKDSYGDYYSSAGAILGIDGGEANSITLEGGRVSMTAGTLQDVNVNGGHMWLYGGTAKNAVVSSGGKVVAGYTCALENFMLADYGYMSLGDGAKATGTVLSAVQVSSSYEGYSWIEDHGGYLNVSYGGVASDTTVGSGCQIWVNYGGVASGATVSDGGYMYLGGYGSDYYGYYPLSWGVADDVTVSSGGSIEIYGGASATNLKLEDGAKATITLVSSAGLGGTLVQGSYAGSAFEVADGHMSNDFSALEKGFGIAVSSGGVLDVGKETRITSGASLFIESGGVVQGADRFTVEQGGNLYVGGGEFTGKIRENGGYVGVYNSGYGDGTPIEFEQNTFTGVTLTFGMSATVHSGTVADGTTILVEYGSNNMSGYGASMQVFSGGIAKNTTVAGGGLYVSSGGTALNTLVNSYGHMELDYRGGASAINTTVAGGGVFYASGGSYGVSVVSETRVSSGGTFYLYTYNGSATADDTVVHSGGTFVMSGYNYGSVFANNTVVSSGGTFGIAADSFGVATVSDTVVESGGVLYLDSPAVTILSGTVFKSGGSLAISEEYRYYSHDDAGFYDTLLESGASITLHNSARAYNPVLGEKAVLELGSDGRAEVVSATAAGATVRVLSRGGVESAFIGTGGVLDVRSGGSAYFTTIDGGVMLISGIPGDGTYAYGYGIDVRNGTLSAGSGAVIGLISAGSGGRIELASGAIVMEQIVLTDDAVLAADGGTVAFQLGYIPGPCIMVDDISRITGTPDYRVLVSESDQAYGEYVIATGAAAFDSTITIIDRYDDPFSPGLGTLTLGGESVQVGDRWYSLMHPDDDAIAVVVTKRALSHDDGPDNGWNDYLYDKKKEKEGKPVLNPNAVDFEANVLTSDLVKVNVDQMYTVYNKDSAGKLWYNFVGNGTVNGEKRADTADFALIHLDYGARLSFDLEATDATKFTVWSFTSGTDKKGNVTYTQKSKQATALKKAKGAVNFTAQTKNLLLEAGDYYVSMQSTNLKKGGAAFYNVKLNMDETAKNYTVFYADGDNGWNNYLYDKKKTPALNPNRYSFPTTYVSAGVSAVRLDSATSHTDETGTWNNFVGFGDDADFARVYLDYGASLSFTVNATDAAKFTIWRLVEGSDKKGNPTYTQKSLQATALKKDKTTGLYSVNTKSLLLERGYYFVSVQSTNAKKGGSAYYNVEFNTAGCEYFDAGDSGWNNWLYDKKKEKEGKEALNSNVYYSSAQTIGSGTTTVSLDGGSYTDESGTLWHNFVGFGDAADFRKIRLDSDAALSFTLKATGAAKFTIWRLDEGTDKKGSTVYTQKALQATVLKQAKGETLFTAGTKALLLEAGVYYVSMESTNAAKGGRAYYEIAVDQDASKFYDSAPTSALLAPQDALPSGALAASSADPALTDGMLSIQDSVLLA